jgi:hypothetical protein
MQCRIHRARHVGIHNTTFLHCVRSGQVQEYNRKLCLYFLPLQLKLCCSKHSRASGWVLSFGNQGWVLSFGNRTQNSSLKPDESEGSPKSKGLFPCLWW